MARASGFLPALPTCNIEFSMGGAGGKVRIEFIQTQVVNSYPFSLTWTPAEQRLRRTGRKVARRTSDGRDPTDPLFSLSPVVPRRNSYFKNYKRKTLLRERRLSSIPRCPSPC